MKKRHVIKTEVQLRALAPEAVLSRGRVEVYRPEHVPVIGDGERGHPVLQSALDHPVDARGAVQEAVFGVAVDVYEIRVVHRETTRPSSLTLRRCACCAGLFDGSLHVLRHVREARATLFPERDAEFSEHAGERAAARFLGEAEEHECAADRARSAGLLRNKCSEERR